MLLFILACRTPSEGPPEPVDSHVVDSPQDSTADSPVDSPVDSPAQGLLVVNELVSDNDGSFKAPDGQVYDWLELTNVGDGPVDLTGLFASDDYDDKTLHPLPELELGPGEYLVLFGTGIEDSTGVFMPFRLSSGGEAVGLFDAQGQAVDWVVFPALSSGAAYARLPDGGDFEVVDVATPEAPNRRLTWKSWELVERGATWSYDDSGSDLGTAWREADFDDSGWATGPAPLGYGDGHHATTVGYGGDPNNKPPATWFRLHFELEELPEGGTLTAELMVDDGAVIWLNGQELLRMNMADGEPTASTWANATVSGSNESAWHRFEVDPSLLVEGDNVLAGEVHQVQAASSDISFGVSLTLEALVED